MLRIYRISHLGVAFVAFMKGFKERYLLPAPLLVDNQSEVFMTLGTFSLLEDEHRTYRAACLKGKRGIKHSLL